MIAVGEFLLAHDVAKLVKISQKRSGNFANEQPMLYAKLDHLKLASRMLEELVAGETVGLKLIAYLAVHIKIYGNIQPIKIQKKYAELAIARYGKDFSPTASTI